LLPAGLATVTPLRFRGTTEAEPGMVGIVTTSEAPSLLTANRDNFRLLDVFADAVSPASRLVLSTLRSATLLDRIVARSLAPFGLHHAQLNALMLLKKHRETGVRPSMIGDYLCVSRPNVTKLLMRLKARKLVEERSDPADGRAVLVVITAEGEVVADRAWDALSSDLAQVVDRIRPETRSSLGRLLDEFRHGLAGALAGDECDAGRDVEPVVAEP
jgi:DNA-binding MarR family transcriptional regulator